jgi:Icc-related predicted phosphoesterase
MKRIVYCADLHGDIERYQAFFEIPGDYHIIGGDLLPKRGYFKTLYEIQRRFLVEFLKPLLEAQKKHTQTLLMLGNDDIESFEDFLRDWKGEGLCYHLHNHLFEIEGFELIGFKYIPPTPFSNKNFERWDSRGITQKQFAFPVLFQADGSYSTIDFESYLKSHPSLAELLEQLPKPRDFSKAIYIMHSPPYNSGIDVTVKKEPVGSQDIRNFITKYQPTLVLCGHIHESPGTIKIGRTVCINPGQLKEFAYTLFELNNGSIEFLKIPPEIS